MAVLSEFTVPAKSGPTAHFITCVPSEQDLDRAEPSSATTSTSDATQASSVQSLSVITLRLPLIHWSSATSRQVVRQSVFQRRTCLWYCGAIRASHLDIPGSAPHEPQF